MVGRSLVSMQVQFLSPQRSIAYASTCLSWCVTNDCQSFDASAHFRSGSNAYENRGTRRRKWWDGRTARMPV